MRRVLVVAVAVFSIMLLGLAARALFAECPVGQASCSGVCVTNGQCGVPDSGTVDVELFADSTFSAGIFFQQPLRSFVVSFSTGLGSGAGIEAFVEAEVTAGADPALRLTRDASGWVVSLHGGEAGQAPPFTASLRRHGAAVAASGWGGADHIARVNTLPSRMRVSASGGKLGLSWEFSHPTVIAPLGKKAAADSADAIVISTAVPATATIDSLRFRGAKVGAVKLNGMRLVRASAPRPAGAK